MLWHMPRRSENLPAEYESYEEAIRIAIGTRIRTRRQALHLSQGTLRARLELENSYISAGQLSRIETGESLPRVIDVIALVKILQVSSSWLLFGDEDAPGH